MKREVVLILALALVLRVVHVLTIRGDPLFDVLPLDSESYDNWAREIAAGHFLRSAPFYQAPLYAYVLGGLHAMTGGDLLAPRLLNAFLGTVHVALVLRLAFLLFGRTPALTAGILAALYAPFLFEEGKVMKTALGLVFSTGSLVLLLEARRRLDSPRLLFAAGLACGLAALVRENFVLVAAAFAALLAWRDRAAARRWRAPGAFTVGTLLALAPSAAHNFAASGEFIPLTSQAGQNFYIGNFSGNPYGGYLVPDFVRRSPRFEEIDFAKEAERRAGRTLSPAATSRFWFRETMRELASDPLRFPRGVLTKLGLLYNRFEIPDDQELRFFRRYAPVLRLPLVDFGAVGILGLLGFAVLARRRALPAELVVFLVVYSMSVAVFFVFARYRLPLVAPLAALAGERIVAIALAVRERRHRSVVLQSLVALPIALFVLRPIDEGTTFANSYLSAGIALEVKERRGEALAEYEAGLALEPSNPKLLRRVAQLRDEIAFREATDLASAGRREEAAARFEALRERAPSTPGIDANLAFLYLQLGRQADAARAAERALALDPNDAEMREIIRSLRAP